MKKIFFVLLSLFLSFSPTSAQTNVSGYQLESATWTKQNSPYVIASNVSFDLGTILTIEPGVKVVLSSGDDLNIFGEILIKGSEEDPVIFTLADGALNDAVLRVFYSTQSMIKHTHFFGVGLDVHGATLDIESLDMENYSDGINVYGGSKVVISNFDINTKNIAITSYEESEVLLKQGSLEAEALSWPQATAVFYNSFVDLDRVTINSTFGTPLVSFGHSLFGTGLVIEGGLQTGIKIYSGDFLLEDSIVRNFTEVGILVYGGNIAVIDSEISNNTKGIEYYTSNELSESKFFLNKIVNNGVGVIAYGNGNNPDQIVDARNNWWGNATGPYVFEGNDLGQGDTIKIFDVQVLFEPWLNAPDDTPEVCCSNVAFLPGIQASRLYKKGILEDQLWEPNISFASDVEYLYLKPDGTSKNTGIYTRDILDRTNSGGNIFDFDVYKTFITTMDKLVSDEKITEWKALPYDWRFDYDTLLTDGVRYETYTQNLVDEVVRLASTSKTKKVSLVTHSNGGLLAKKLVDKLKSQGHQDIVDQMILVAPPQLGTPKTIGSMLHGEEQTIKLIAGKATIRQLGENMKSAYNLIPSPMYFDIVNDPVIKIASSTNDISNLYRLYGSEVDSHSELVAFLTASRDGRTDPRSDEVAKPNVLNSVLLNNATNVHTQIDDWTPPEGIDLIQVVGWGVFTTSGLEYFKNDKGKLDYKTIKTIDGDETVVTPSVTANAGRTYYLDMLNYNVSGSASKHTDIMEVTDIKALISELLTDSLVTLPEYITLEKPSYKDYPNLRIGLHSPVSLGVYDGLGNFTGVKVDEETGKTYIEEGIPNSLYEEVGEGKYVYLFDHTNPVIKLEGLGTGTFTLEIEKQEGGVTIEEKVFADIPTTANTLAEVVLEPEAEPILQLDIEGDGVVDVELESNTELTPLEYIGLLKKTVLELQISKKIKDKLIKRIEKIEKLLQKGVDKKLIKKIRDFNYKLKHLSHHEYNKHHHKHITKTDVEVLITMINELLDLLEQK